MSDDTTPPSEKPAPPPSGEAPAEKPKSDQVLSLNFAFPEPRKLSPEEMEKAREQRRKEYEAAEARNAIATKNQNLLSMAASLFPLFITGSAVGEGMDEMTPEKAAKQAFRYAKAFLTESKNSLEEVPSLEDLMNAGKV